MAVKWGIISTADINGKLLAGAAASDEVEVVAVGSRELEKAHSIQGSRARARNTPALGEDLARFSKISET